MDIRNFQSSPGDSDVQQGLGATGLEQCFIKFPLHQNHLKALLKHRLLGASPRDFDSIVLGWSVRICISNKFPDDSNAAGLLTTTGLINCPSIITAHKITEVKIKILISHCEARPKILHF